jgi:hypothetical protein
MEERSSTVVQVKGFYGWVRVLRTCVLCVYCVCIVCVYCVCIVCVLCVYCVCIVCVLCVCIVCVLCVCIVCVFHNTICTCGNNSHVETVK